MSERFFLVELRCASCGLIFCNAARPVPEHNVDEYRNMFLAKGPEKFIQCKNRCPRWRDDEPRPIESPFIPPKNTNLRVIVTEVPEQELRSRGLMR